LITTHPARAQEPTWKAGVAKAVITPEKAVWLAGYGSKRPPDGKLHDLWMKALALEDPAGQRVVLVTSDFQGIPKEMSDRIFAQLQKKLKLERRQVMITFSHNHCGPRVGSDLVDYYPIEAEQVQLIEEYTTQMEAKMVEMIAEALTRLAPAGLHMGEGRATFAVNRRNNREADVPTLLAKGEALKGPVDHAVPVLTVSRPDKSLLAVVFGYACHPTTLSFTKWCGDYPGFAQITLEKNHPGVQAMFVNTCGGDQNPLPRRKVELCERYGAMLAEAVEDTLKRPLKAISPSLRTSFEHIDLAYDKVITRPELQEAAQNDPNAIRKRWAERLLKKLDAGETFASSYPYPIHAWRLGKEMLMIGLGAEAVVDFSLRFKTEFGAGTWVSGYVDDLVSYIPSRRVWAEGGYEGGSFLFEYGRPALRWAGDVEERIATSVHQQVQALAGNWPQFRGPRGSGQADVRQLPAEWGDKKNLAWKVAIPGDGWSSPIVWGERLFLTTAVEEKAEEMFRWEVHCLDALTGKTRWKHLAGRGKAPIAIHTNNTFASETPATDGKRLYAYFGMKGLFCCDMDGKPLWTKDLGVFPTVDDMGTASSPALAEGRLFILCDNAKSPFLAAFKAETGEEIWRKQRPSKSSWSSPFIWRNKQRTELVACGSGVIQSFDPATGKLFWSISGLQGKFTATPVGNDDLLYAGSASAFDEGPLFAVKAGASGELTLPKGNGSTEGIAWSRPRSGPGTASPLLNGEQIYVFNRGFVLCFDARTGDKLYKERLPDCGSFLASPWAAAGRVFGMDESGQTYVLAPGATFKLLSKNWVYDTFWASPAVMEGTIYLRGVNHLYCVRQP